MQSKIESALKLHSRLRPIGASLDERVIDEQHFVTVVDVSDGHLIAANHFIHNTCKLILEESAPNLCSQPLLVSLDDRSDADMDTEETEADDWPSIVIFDGMAAFDALSLSTLLSNDELLRGVLVYTSSDENQLLVSLYSQIRSHLALNTRLKLIVIYANCCLVYPKAIDAVIDLLSSFPLSVRVILVVNRITKRQLKRYTEKCKFQVITCECSAINTIAIKKYNEEVVIERQITQNIGLTDS